MTINEYQSLAMRTANADGRALGNVGLGIAGEAGEVADAIKKHLYQNHELDKDKLVGELGDVCWYVALGAEVLGVPLEEIMQRNIDKLKARYPEGFDAERSIHRKSADGRCQTCMYDYPVCPALVIDMVRGAGGVVLDCLRYKERGSL